MECIWLLLNYIVWIEHQFLSGIRDSKKAGSLWEMMSGVGGVRKSIDQSWLANRLGLLWWGFKGVQKEIPSEESSTLQIGYVAFTLGQCTSPQLSVTDYFTKMGIKTHPQPPYCPDLAPSDFWLFSKLRGSRLWDDERSCRYEEMKEAVTKVIDSLKQEDFDGAFQKLLER